MKRLLACAFAVLLTAFPLSVAAEEVPQAETAPPVQYNYGLDEEGHAELYDFLLSDTFTGELTIPTEIEGHPVDYVGNACFMNAKGITGVTIPASLIDIGDSVFFGCTALTHFNVEAGNPYYSVNDGVLMADESKFLVAYPAAKAGTSYMIPAGVEELAPGAFGFAQNLTEVAVPTGVFSIDNWCFAYSNLQKVNIDGSVQEIDDYAFAYCESLREVNLSAGLDTIYHAAFAYDKALTQVTIPNTVRMIGQYAFCGTGLPCVTIPTSVEEISFCAFGYDSNLTAIADFTIYGEPYSIAQDYATAVDEENDYQNNFTFIAVENADIPYELGGGKLYGENDTQEAAQDAVQEELTETDDAGNAVPVEEPGGNGSLREEIGAGLFGNQKLQLIIGIGGGVAVLLAAVLVAAFAKKPKKSEDTDDEE